MGTMKEAKVSNVSVLVGRSKAKYRIIIVRAVKSPPKAMCLEDKVS